MICVIAGIATIVNSKELRLFLVGAQIVFYSIVALFCLTLVIKAVRETILSMQQLEATCADCDAGDALHGWLKENPDKGWSDPIVQKLLRRQIETREHFLEVHDSLTGNKSHVDYLKARLL